MLNPNKQKAILYFGGRSESVAKNIEEFKNAFLNHTVYLVNYRSYGGSTGVATEENLYNDAKFIYNKIAKQHDDISVIGRSLGTGIATYIASSLDVKKMVLVTPYDSILNMAKDKYPFYPIEVILKDQYNSLQRVPSIKIPTLVLLASTDETIDAKYSDNLIQKFTTTDLNVYTIPNSGHNNIIDKNEYLKRIKYFLEDRKY